ncbi:hypothetical protein ROZALSC1DRAFT_23373 [Rozella allomycis CSF55]|uniref:ARM repeat-containing protein n=1 Tax=Rozella allomycis (strain CSF55) TaxID=988480 RepID=A0A4P9YG79_ROZAC|nr:hypothetical protein ROZALSC1DRAFT_23373 [Rozella allomycis CSF55]
MAGKELYVLDSDAVLSESTGNLVENNKETISGGKDNFSEEAFTEDTNEITPDDLAVDENLPLEEKILYCVNSELVLHRLYACKQIVIYCETQIAFSTDFMEKLKSFLRILSQDPEHIIREGFAYESLKAFKILLPNGVEEVLESIILRSYIEGILDDRKQAEAVKAACWNCYIEAISFLPVKCQRDMVGEFMRQAFSESSETIISCLLELLQGLNEVVSEDVINEYFVPIFVDFAKHHNYLIRRLCIENVCLYSEKISTLAVKNVFEPMIVRASGDISWIVRNAVAQGISSVIKKVQDKIDLLKSFQSLLSDESIPEVIIETYLEMTTLENESKRDDDKRSQLCAYYFPGVLLTLGKHFWPRQLAKFCAIFAFQDVDEVLPAIFYQLLIDDVAQIRSEVTTQVPKMWETVISKAEEASKHPNYHIRLDFIEIAFDLFENKDYRFLPQIEALCKDRVKNVRSHIALKLIHCKCSNAFLLPIRTILSNDEDKEVQKLLKEFDVLMELDTNLVLSMISPSLESMTITKDEQDEFLMDVDLTK